MSTRGSGWIVWPKSKATVPAEGNGTWVYAFWFADYTGVVPMDGTKRDLFVRCHGPEYTLMMPRPAAVTSPNRATVYPPTPVGPVAPQHPDAGQRAAYLRSTLDAGRPILGGICLGSAPRCWRDAGTGEPWYAQLGDLGRNGKALIRRLNDLFGERDAELVTYIDMD